MTKSGNPSNPNPARWPQDGLPRNGSQTAHRPVDSYGLRHGALASPMIKLAFQLGLVIVPIHANGPNVLRP
jgi:hypothetical protein